MTETIVESTTGGRKGQKPARHSLVPARALTALAEQYAYGAEKYGDPHNWSKGYSWSLSYDALIRHAVAFWGGQDVDEEGRPHMAAVAFHAFTLLEFLSDEGYAEFDDRPTKPSPALDRVMSALEKLRDDFKAGIPRPAPQVPPVADEWVAELTHRPVPVIQRTDVGGYLTTDDKRYLTNGEAVD